MKQYDVVGCGSVVRQYHAPILRNLARRNRIRIHGCYDVNPQAAREMGSFLGAARMGLPDDIGDLAGVDAVLIATPPESHARFLEQYLSAKKAALVEKPFVVSRAEAERVVDLSRATDAPVLVGHFRRFYPGVRTARSFLSAGGLGRIRRVEASEGARWNWPSMSPYVVENPYGGVIYDTGSHLLDMTLYLLEGDGGTDTSFQVRNVTKLPTVEPSHECRAVIELSKPGLGPVEISFAVSRLEPLAGAVKVYGDSGILIVPTAYSDAPLLIHDSRPFALAEQSGGPEPRDALGCFVMEHQQFLALGRGAHPESPLSAHQFVTLTSILEALGHSSDSMP